MNKFPSMNVGVDGDNGLFSSGASSSNSFSASGGAIDSDICDAFECLASKRGGRGDSAPSTPGTGGIGGTGDISSVIAAWSAADIPERVLSICGGLSGGGYGGGCTFTSCIPGGRYRSTSLSIWNLAGSSKTVGTWRAERTRWEETRARRSGGMIVEMLNDRR